MYHDAHKVLGAAFGGVSVLFLAAAVIRDPIGFFQIGLPLLLIALGLAGVLCFITFAAIWLYQRIVF